MKQFFLGQLHMLTIQPPIRRIILALYNCITRGNGPRRIAALSGLKLDTKKLLCQFPANASLLR